MNYRREIDGLRAVAVIPVIFFHAGFDSFGGGFVGVDVFFVISGYLITSIILAEKRAGTFSIAAFYERRARRILPALYLVMLVSLPVGWVVLMPADMKDFARSLLAVSLFGSNIYFEKHSGYFDTAAEFKPMLHTWSLGVEEQYYVLFPLLLALLWRLKRHWRAGILLAAALASLAIAEEWSRSDPMAAFFLLPARGWELLLGVLVALYLQSKNDHGYLATSNRLTAEIAGAIGLLLIAFATFSYDQTVPFPGVYALVPTLGTALIILYATPKTLVGRVLGVRLLVGVGLISYSTYLWHQPLFAFARHINRAQPEYFVFLLLALAAILLAYLSWRYIELPFRKRGEIGRKTVFGAALVGVLAFVSLGFAGKNTRGFVDAPGRMLHLTGAQRKVLQFLDYDYQPLYRKSTCLLTSEQTQADFSRDCGAPDRKDPVVIWGDSHAAALLAGIRSILPNTAQYTTGGCPPLLGADFRSHPDCRGINEYVIRQIANIRPARVFLHANWPGYLAKVPASSLAETLTTIRTVSPATRVTVIGSVPQWQPNVPMAMLGNGLSLDREQTMKMPGHAQFVSVDRELEQVAVPEGAEFFSVLQNVCVDDRCQVVVRSGGGYEPLSWDASHLTRGGSMMLAEKLLAQ